MRYEQHPMFDFYYFEKYNIKQKQVKKFSDDNYNKFLLLCKDENGCLRMNSRINTEWVFRSYFAAKMVMASTLLLNNAEYCINKNVLVTVPYLLYYAALSSARGFLYASPFEQTDDLEKLITINHSKVLNLVPDLIKNHFDKNLGEEVQLLLNYLKSQRELFSYKFPASGILNEIKYEQTVDICGLLAELTELSSYKIQEVYERKFVDIDKLPNKTETSWMSFDQEIIQKSYKYDSVEITGDKFERVDSEDFYRIDYINRKIKFPTSVIFTMTEGMTEDFFGAWCKSKESLNEDDFNPDLDWNRIFPIP